MISSRDNALIKETRKLLNDAKARRQSARFVIEGARLCEDAARSGVSIQTLLYTAEAAQTYAGQFAAVSQAAEKMMEISSQVCGALSETKSPQGMFCVCSALDNIQSFDTIKKYGYYVALENLQDPGNMGTVIRTAEALGVDGLILSAGCCDILSPKVLRSSMGGVFRMKLFHAADLPAQIVALQQEGMTAYACVVDGGALPVTQASFSQGSVCVIGNEGNGLTVETVEACRQPITIPMNGRAESLNASMAAGIVMWEMMKSR